MQASSSSSLGESSVSARIRASASALQLERNLLLVKESKLCSLVQEQQLQAGLRSLSPALASIASTQPADPQQLLARADPIMARSDILATRKAHLQVDIYDNQHLCNLYSAISNTGGHQYYENLIHLNSAKLQC